MITRPDMTEAERQSAIRSAKFGLFSPLLIAILSLMGISWHKAGSTLLWAWIALLVASVVLFFVQLRRIRRLQSRDV
jgi:FtsH-binding integral membrane protein